MAWRVLCEGVSLEEAVKVAADRLRAIAKQHEEWLANQKNQQLVQSSEVPTVNVTHSSPIIDSEKDSK